MVRRLVYKGLTIGVAALALVTGAAIAAYNHCKKNHAASKTKTRTQPPPARLRRIDRL